MADTGNSTLGKWQGGPKWYRHKQYGKGADHSGNAGRRNSNERNKMARAAVGQAKSHTIVIFCNDQHGCLGTGYIGNYHGARM